MKKEAKKVKERIEVQIVVLLAKNRTKVVIQLKLHQKWKKEDQGQEARGISPDPEALSKRKVHPLGTNEGNQGVESGRE